MNGADWLILAVLHAGTIIAAGLAAIYTRDYFAGRLPRWAMWCAWVNIAITLPGPAVLVLTGEVSHRMLLAAGGAQAVFAIGLLAPRWRDIRAGLSKPPHDLSR